MHTHCSDTPSCYLVRSIPIGSTVTSLSRTVTSMTVLNLIDPDLYWVTKFKNGCLIKFYMGLLDFRFVVMPNFS